MKYIFLIKRAEINDVEQDPSIGMLYLEDTVADALIKAKKAVAVPNDQIGPAPEAA